jgi:hypothetical protein
MIDLLKIGGKRPKGASFLCWQEDSHPKKVSGCYAAEPRGRAVGGEPVGMAPQIDLYEASLGLGIETVGGQIESQILSAHAGIIEAGYQRLKIRE